MSDDTKQIFDRYALALRIASNGHQIATDAALVVLHLALREVDESYSDVTSQIRMLNEWLEEYRPSLYHDPQLVTGEAMICAAEDLRTENETLREELDSTTRSAAAAVHAEDASIHAAIVRNAEALLEQYASDLHDRLLSGEFTTVDQALAVQLERNDRVLKSVIDLRDKEAVRRHNAEHRVVELDAENARLRQIETFLRAELADANRRAAVITGNGKSQPAAVLVQTFDVVMQNPPVMTQEAA